MKRKLAFLFTILSFLFVSIAGNTVAAASGLADGKYTIQYTILKGDNDSASMANDYFLKPATLNVSNGAIEAQVKLKQSEWIKALSVQGAPVNVVSQDAVSNTRVISFNVSDLSKPVSANMHVLIEEQDYDHNYTVRFSFDQSSLTAVDVPQSNATSDNNSNVDNGSKETAANTTETSEDQGSVTESTQAESNPKTGDSTTESMILFIVMLCGSLYFLYRLKVKSAE